MRSLRLPRVLPMAVRGPFLQRKQNMTRIVCYTLVTMERWPPTPTPPSARAPERAAEREARFEPVIPRGWTYLKHGTNAVAWPDTDLVRVERVEVKRPLSVITRESAEVDRAGDGNYNTTQNYASSEGRAVEGMTAEEVRARSKAVELRILFFQNHARSNKDPEFRAGLDEETMKLIAKYYFNNVQQGRHPLVPVKTQLVRLGSTMEDGHDVVYFLPENLREVYQKQGGVVPAAATSKE